MPHSLDIIGDVHGELPALEALGRRLGYRVAEGWTHPDGRLPVFLGDLVDRGAHSLAVAELVKGLVEERRAFCIMGNHEYNLVAWYAGWMEPKASNRATTELIQHDRGAWVPVLSFFRQLPVALELDDLRIIHACWHIDSLNRVNEVLGRAVDSSLTDSDAFGWLERHVVLRSPFDLTTPLTNTRLLPGLPTDATDPSGDPPHEVLLKGHEVPVSEPFPDTDGKWRHKIRAMWWRDGRGAVIDDRRMQVFGHYGGVPPVEGDMAPPYPTGHPDLRRWAQRLVVVEKKVPDSDAITVKWGTAGGLRAVCVDFHAVTCASHRACIGALRWPEGRIEWATEEKQTT